MTTQTYYAKYVVTDNSQPAPETFGREYFETTTVRPYRRDAIWQAYFARRAALTVMTLGIPIGATLLDAGCAMGMEVGAFRMLGVDAWGIDASAYAISQAHPDIQPFLKRWHIAFDGDWMAKGYDLVTCIEVLEHLPEKESISALENLTRTTDRILFSSTPFDHTEPTHYNVQEPAYWHLLFAQQGFQPDTEFDASFITPWATLYKRVT